ncbi:MAG: hypothetical protein HZA46_18580 [Planctomycetales bacterium]|nr:hypothetical protein [Planctomycetales bacterium]
MKSSSHPSGSRPAWLVSISQTFSLPALHMERETAVYVVVNALDVLMTYLLLTHDQVEFIEANPLARYFLYSWGPKGMVWFKVALVTLVTLNVQLIARKRPDIAQRVLYLAIAIVSGVVIYSVFLFVRHSA